MEPHQRTFTTDSTTIREIGRELSNTDVVLKTANIHVDIPIENMDTRSSRRRETAGALAPLSMLEL